MDDAETGQEKRNEQVRLNSMLGDLEKVVTGDLGAVGPDIETCCWTFPLSHLHLLTFQSSSLCSEL